MHNTVLSKLFYYRKEYCTNRKRKKECCKIAIYTSPRNWGSLRPWSFLHPVPERKWNSSWNTSQITWVCESSDIFTRLLFSDLNLDTKVSSVPKSSEFQIFVELADICLKFTKLSSLILFLSYLVHLLVAILKGVNVFWNVV